MSHSLNWVRLDTALPTHPKMFELYATQDWRAVMLYVWGITYAGMHSTDGYVPKTVVTTLLQARIKDAQRLVQVGLWHESTGGYEINGWDEYQVSDDAAKRRKERAQKAAAARWAESGGKQ